MPASDSQRDSSASDGAVPADNSREKHSPDTSKAGNGNAASSADGSEELPWLRGAIIFTVASTLLTFFMAWEVDYATRPPHSTLYGFVLLLVAVAGLLDALGLLRVTNKANEAFPSWRQSAFGQMGEPRFFQPAIALPLALATTILGAVVLGHDHMPWVILVSLAFLLPAAFYRPGLGLMLIACAIYLPFLGFGSLWDPWETHYGEVAREIVARNDWISLWWAHEHWFMSKPIFIFWTEALSIITLGADASPDANWSHPEWAIRLPIALLSLSAIGAAYHTLKRTFGQRAALLGGLALTTAPTFFMIAHQAITDMPLTGNLTIAVCMFICAITTPKEDLANAVKIGRGRFSFLLGWRQFVLGIVALLALPQALYLISRNFTVYWNYQTLDPWYPEVSVPHGDSFLFGSAGNDATIVFGQARHAIQTPFANAWIFQPASQGILWLIGLAAVIFLLRKENRQRYLYMYAFYVFCALGFMGKGIPGIALPGLVALLYLIVSQRFSLLFSGALRILPGALVCTIIGLPWFIAMYMRHGPAFTDRLLIHDHINRLAQGVHGDKGSIEYFLEQLGAGLFPWGGLAVVAIAMYFWTSFNKQQSEPGSFDDKEARGWRGQQATIIFVFWFLGAFTLFSSMVTKFHHYIFPTVPAAALLAGILLSKYWGTIVDGFFTRAATTLAVLSPLPLILGIAGLMGDVRGIVPIETLKGPDGQDPASSVIQSWGAAHPWPTWLCVTLIIVAIAAFVWSMLSLTPAEEDNADPERSTLVRHALTSAAAAAFALALFAARDLSWATNERPRGYERLIHLFVYRYTRAWPEQFDYRPILAAFAIVCMLMLALLVLPRVRAAATRGFVGAAIIFSAWSVNIYFQDLSPHWGMRVLFKKYYAERKGPEEEIVAWQMNWKGENFYTGNRVNVFIDSGAKSLKDWMKTNKGKGAYFMCEWDSQGGLSSAVGNRIKWVSTKWENNKFRLGYIESM